VRDILTFAELTLREAYRRMLVWVGLILGLIFVALYATGFYYIHRDMVRSYGERNIYIDSGFNFTVMAAFYVVSFLGVMLAVLTSVGTLSGEISSHTIQSLAARPVRRSSIVLGKWLGLATLITAYILFLAGGVILATWIISGYVPAHAAIGVSLIVLQALIMLSLSILGSTRLSTIANGVLAFMLYGVAFVGGWIEQIGTFANNASATEIGIISSLLVPSEAMWKMAAYEMQPPALNALGVSPFSVGNRPSTAMLIYAVIYAVTATLLAVRAFSRRDL